MEILKSKSVIFLASFFGSLYIAAPEISLGEEESSEVTHFIDTANDRTPARTAFPRYPSIARRDRIQGEATVCFNIRTDGKISRPVVTNYTHRIFSKPALRAIRKSTFEPLAPGQILRTARTCRTYRFRLEPILVKNETSG